MIKNDQTLNEMLITGNFLLTSKSKQIPKPINYDNSKNWKNYMKT